MGHYDYKGLWEKLKAAGYNTTSIRRDGVLGQRTLTSIRAGKPIAGETIANLCERFECQPGDLMKYVSDAEEAKERAEHGE